MDSIDKKITRSNLFGCEIDCIGQDQFKNKIEQLMLGSDQSLVVKINSEFIIRVINEKEFQKTVSSADLVITDGVGVQWAAKYLSLPITGAPVLRQLQAVWQMVYTGASLVFYPDYCCEPIPERFPGVEALKMMLKIAEEKSEKVYFFGAEKETLTKAVASIKEMYPKLDIVGFRHGYDYESQEVVKDINRSKATLLIVGLGSPKQEYWIRDHLKALMTVKIAVGEGGSLDRIANPDQLAPKWMNSLGLEWLWRLFANKNKTIDAPHRFIRVFRSVPVFIYKMVKFKLTNGAVRNDEK